MRTMIRVLCVNKSNVKALCTFCIENERGKKGIVSGQELIE